MAYDTLSELRANPPRTIEEVDPWLANYMALVEASRLEAIATDRLNEAATDLLAALEAEQEWRERDADGAIDPEWDYERMVGDLRRAAIAKATGAPNV